MRKLQELALGGVGGAGPSSSAANGKGAASAGGGVGRRPSTRGRQLLYWESLKSKAQDGPSMSWRGGNEFAHEQPAGPARPSTSAR
jgi:hypothetical protein